ncbi:unnamed protein product [Sphagnum compactum]
MVSAEMVDVMVRTLDGKQLHLTLEANKTLHHLKLQLQQLEWPAPNVLHFHLFLRGEKLDAAVRIASLQLENEFLVLIPFTKKKHKKAQTQFLTTTTTTTTTLGHQLLLGSLDSNAPTPIVDRQNASSEHAAAAAVHHDGKESFKIEYKNWMQSHHHGHHDDGEEDDHDFASRMCVAESQDQPQTAASYRTKSSSEDVWQAIATDMANFHSSHSKDAVMMMPTSIDMPEAHVDSLHTRSSGIEDMILVSSSGEEEERSRPEKKARKKGNHRRNSSTKQQEEQFEVVALPPALERMKRVFVALNSVYGFLQRQHMQATWSNVKHAVQQLADKKICVQDIENLATFCPKAIVFLHSLTGCNFSMTISYDLRLRRLYIYCVGGKRITDRQMRNAIERRQKVFQGLLLSVFQQLQAKPNSEKLDMEHMSIESWLAIAKAPEMVGKLAKPGLPSALPRPPRHHKKLARCMEVLDMNANEMLQHLKEKLGSLGQIVHCECLRPREASYGELKSELSTFTQAALERQGITRMYSHQAKGINAVQKGQSIVVATSTASGKSLCYNVPVLEMLNQDSSSCALYLFPTKALAQDQLRALLELTGGPQTAQKFGIGVYDGDTNQELRLRLRESARVLITNPDMLHVSIMPSHCQFECFLAHLRYVVVDEAHAYRGVFGCHTALIMRRLRRLLHHLYGTEPTFIVCSATVANPREHAMELVGLRDVEVIQEDGSPCGEKTFVFWNPPIVFEQVEKRHFHTPLVEVPIVEVASLLAEMVQHGLRCLAFCNTRKLCELVHNYTREILKETAPALTDTIRAYRAGYTAHDRRDIEKDLFAGRLRGVAATNALELGVDIGSLDATLHLGFPGSVASMWQQSGRAGRREKAALSVYVAFGGPLDQHFMKAPQKLFMKPIEHAQVDASNEQVVEQHLACAAFEHPLNVTHDEAYLGSGIQSAIVQLVKQGQLGRHPSNSQQVNSWHYIGQQKCPSQAVSIRAICPEKYTVINQATNEVIEEVEESKAFFEVYEGAVYMHQGKTYLCRSLDIAAKVALCQEADLKYYTKTRDFTDVHVLGGELAYPAKVSEMKYPKTTAQASRCKVTTRWIGFRRIWQGSNETFDSVDLFLPDVSYDSQAAWIRVPHLIRGDLEAESLSFREGIHAASHALVNVMPLYIMCNQSDLGCDCANPHDTRYYPERLLVFDKHPGGIGIAAQACPMFAELLQAALEQLVACDCTTETGCPACVQYFGCSEYNEVINKRAAIIILQGVINTENKYREGKQEPPPPSPPPPNDGFLQPRTGILDP